MNTEALLKLAELMDTTPPEKLDLRHWACGTTACVIGHAMYNPWFNERGFYAQKSVLTRYPAPAYIDPLESDDGWPTPPAVGWGAVYEFFGLTQTQADYLFLESTYAASVTPSVVAARLREFASAKDPA